LITNPIERRLSLVVKPRQIRTVVRIARSVLIHVEPVARLHLVDRLKDEERLDHVELVHKDVVKDVVKEGGEVLVAVGVPVAVAPKVAVVVGRLVPALATRILVETVLLVVLGLLVLALATKISVEKAGVLLGRPGLVLVVVCR
jgi:hypothetical protein